MVDKNHNPADLNKKQQVNQWVNASTLIFHNVSAVDNIAELYSLVRNVIEREKMKDEDIKMVTDKTGDSVTYEMVGKKLCLDIAHHAENAFKHYHPTLEIHNPKDNEFVRATVTFNK